MGLNKRLIGAGATGGAFVNSENFKAVTYTGNGGTQAITGVGFKPDFVWLKCRSTSHSHFAADSTRGVTKYVMPNETSAELTRSDQIQSFDTDGFTLAGNGDVNGSSKTYVAWCWKSGQGTTASNSDGNITTTVQVNAAAGFSIVKGTTPSSPAATDLAGHGLGVAPDMIIYKPTTVADDWYVYHSYMGLNEFMKLQSSDGQATATDLFGTVNATGFSTNNTNTGNRPFIAYCFKAIDGFSSFGSYTGNGNANGPIIDTGFEPAFVMIKEADQSNDWNIYDNKRTTANPRDVQLLANSSAAESTNTSIQVDFLSNGFQCKGNGGGLNRNNSNFIYMAFAADPDTEAPTLASSFNIETWTGSGVDNTLITGLGFSPNMVWYKTRTASNDHNLIDSIRGATFQIRPNRNIAQVNATDQIKSIDSDGFTLGNGGDANSSGNDYVAWTWKANDDEPTALYESSAVAAYKFEDNSNDVGGSYNGTAANVTYVSGGQFNKAVRGVASNSKVTLNTPTPSGSFTFSLWVYNESTSGAPSVIMGTGSNWIIGWEANKVQMLINSSNRGSGYAISQDTWYHLGVTYNGSGTTQLYVDGTLRETITGITPSGAFGAVKLFSQDLGFWGVFEGRIDQVRVYSEVLSAANITALYNETTSDNSTLAFPNGIPNGAFNSLVSANNNAGFSIVKGTTPSSPADSDVTLHGLSAAPNMIIFKPNGVVEDWYVYHSSTGLNKATRLNTTASQGTTTSLYGAVNATSFKNKFTNTGDRDYIAYCFHDVAGYQKFGNYTGDGGNGTGPTVTVGFKPDFLMIKRSSDTGNWLLFDSRRGDKLLFPNDSDAEQSLNYVEFLSTGFKIIAPSDADGGTNINLNGSTYIYWAIAKNVPSNTTLANSFKVVTYSSSGGSGSTEVSIGWSPDLVITKARDEGAHWSWGDTLRGANSNLSSNDANAVNTTNQWRVTDFHTSPTSISIAKHASLTTSNVTYAWKAGNTWQSNVDGTIPSTTNTNTGNGFSIVQGTASGGLNTVNSFGHGLGVKPEVIILKSSTSTDNWYVYHTSVGAGKRLDLNDDAAASTSAEIWANTEPTSSVFSIKDGQTLSVGATFIAYCWTSVTGYSKFGSYSGSGSAISINTGFQADFVMIKRTNASGYWNIFDSVRGGDKRLYPNASSAETDESSDYVTFDSDGFNVDITSNSDLNTIGGTWIYMAFKMN